MEEREEEDETEKRRRKEENVRKNLGIEEDEVMRWEEEMGKERREGRYQEEEE